MAIPVENVKWSWDKFRNTSSWASFTGRREMGGRGMLGFAGYHRGRQALTGMWPEGANPSPVCLGQPLELPGEGFLQLRATRRNQGKQKVYSEVTRSF
jgi:hypothetical protein